MQHRRVAIERGFLLGHGGQRLPLDLDQLARVLGERARSRDHHDDRLALPAGAIDGHRILRGRLHAGKARERADPGRRAHLGDLGAGHHPDNARRALGRARLDAHDLGMSMRAANECGMQHARQRHVVGIGCTPGHRTTRAHAREGAADIAVRPIERGQAGLGIHCGFIRCAL